MKVFLEKKIDCPYGIIFNLFKFEQLLIKTNLLLIHMMVCLKHFICDIVLKFNFFENYRHSLVTKYLTLCIALICKEQLVSITIYSYAFKVVLAYICKALLTGLEHLLVSVIPNKKRDRFQDFFFPFHII